MTQVALPGGGFDEDVVESDACYTPQYILEAAERILGGPIETDPCWSLESLVRPTRYGWTIRDRGETQPWYGRTFVNPPYSDPGPFMQRAAAHDAPTVALVKLDPSTAWWKDNISSRWEDMEHGMGICLLDHRVKFKGGYAGGGAAPFPSALITWRCTGTGLRLGHWLWPL